MALVVVVLLVILGLVSLQLFLFAKVGGSSALSFGAGAGATLLPGYGGNKGNAYANAGNAGNGSVVERFAKPHTTAY
jgi:hypothetical protein